LGILYRQGSDYISEEIFTKDNFPSILSTPAIFKHVTVNGLLRDQTTADCRVFICVTDKEITSQVSEAISKSLNKDGQCLIKEGMTVAKKKQPNLDFP